MSLAGLPGVGLVSAGVVGGPLEIVGVGDEDAKDP